MRPSTCWLLPVLLTCCCLASVACAAGTESPYSGDFLTRSTVTGDWGGMRNELAAKGVTVDGSLTVTDQGVVEGGKNRQWEEGGRANLLLNMDTGKMGLWPGGFLKVEVEGNFGQGVNTRNGGIMPVNTNQVFPIPNDAGTSIPNISFAQFLSEYVGIEVGKLDTTGGDMNEFAHGKGDSQFMNLAFNINPSVMVAIPYSTLGAGLIVLPTKDPKSAVISLLAVSAVGKASTAGFDEVSSDKASYALEGRIRTDFFGKTGHQLLGALYSTRDFASLDQRLVLEPGANQVQTQSDTWALYYNFDQYLYEPTKGSGRGIGIFGRFAATDGNPNPIHYFMSFGIGGKGVISSRPHDSFGVGWYYLDINQPTFTGPLATRTALRDEQGVEAYYNFALTPWLLLTPDVQVIHGAQKHTAALLPANRQPIDTATILGLRLQLLF